MTKQSCELETPAQESFRAPARAVVEQGPEEQHPVSLKAEHGAKERVTVSPLHKHQVPF